MQPEHLPLDPLCWRKPHLDLVGARVIFPADLQALAAMLRLSSVPIEHDFHLLVSGRNIDTVKDEYSWVRFASKRLQGLTRDTGCQHLSASFLYRMIHYLMPDHFTVLQHHLWFQLGGQEVDWYPAYMVGDMFAMVCLGHPSSVFAEQTAYCLALAQNARNKGSVGVKCGEGFVLPTVVSIREALVTLVMAKLDMDILENIEAIGLDTLKGGQAHGGGTPGFDVYVLRWDLRTFEGRLEFVQFLAPLLRYLTE
jgi:hypothetical protein